MVQRAGHAKSWSVKNIDSAEAKPEHQPSPVRRTWAAAAAAGLLLTGCPDSSSPEGSGHEDHHDAPAKAASAQPGADKECCMGLNDCKGKGGCAVPESNACAGKNECKGKGGCNMHCPK
jgi:hypothetical protein